MSDSQTAEAARLPRILIVDDERKNRQLLEVMLAGEGYQFRLAKSGEEALVMVASQRPDLILLDVMMPGMNGYEVATVLNTDPATRHIPIIIVTALNDTNSRLHGLSAGAVAVLTKPVQRSELCLRVRTLLRPEAPGMNQEQER